MSNETQTNPDSSEGEHALVQTTPEQRRAVLLDKLHAPAGLTEAEVAEYDGLLRGGQGGAGGAQPTGGVISPEARARIDAIDARMLAIAADMHKEGDEARRRFELAQPEYHRLAAEKIALLRGEPAKPAPAKQPAKVEATPTPITSLPDLPPPEGEAESSWADERISQLFLPTFAELGLQPKQVERIFARYREVEEEAVKLREEQRAEQQSATADAAKTACEEFLAATYGAGWRAEVARGNEFLRRRLGDDAKLGLRKLVDGSALGSDQYFAKFVIDLAREFDRRR